MTSGVPPVCTRISTGAGSGMAMCVVRGHAGLSSEFSPQPWHLGNFTNLCRRKPQACKEQNNVFIKNRTHSTSLSSYIFLMRSGFLHNSRKHCRESFRTDLSSRETGR